MKEVKEGDADQRSRRCRRGWGDTDHQSRESEGDACETWGDAEADDHDPLFAKTWGDT